MDDIYNVLMSLPLLNGMSRNKMLEIAGKTKFHFLKFEPNQKIITAGTPCTHLRFILSGSVVATTQYTSNIGARIKVSQTIDAPTVLCLEHLFGPVTTYPCDITTIEKVNGLQITKSDYIKLISANQILNFNYLNALSTMAQNKMETIAVCSTINIQDRLAYFISMATKKQSRNIEISPVAGELSDFFCCTKDEFAYSLDALTTLGLANYSNSTLKIRSRDELLNILMAI